MRRFSVVTLLMMCFWSLPAAAASLQVSDGLHLEYMVPDGWQATTKVPDFLVRQTVEHVSQHMREEGRAIPVDLENQVRVRLANNELFLFHEKTGTHFDIDFSPIEVNETPPLRESVARSAYFAEQELIAEPDVTEVESSSKEFALSGTEYAYRIDATFKRDGEPRRFIGIIAFIERHWLFLYYTEETLSDSDLQQFEKLLKELVVVAR
jgi:hypothetical protein